MIRLDLNQARELLEFFGGCEADVTVSYLADAEGGAHSGPGVYAWCTEYPSEGSIRLDSATDLEVSDGLWAWLKGGDGVAPAAQPKRCLPCNQTGLAHCQHPDECGGPWDTHHGGEGGMDSSTKGADRG